MIGLATLTRRVTLENGTAPPVPALLKADSSDMDNFLSQLQIVFQCSASTQSASG